MEINKKYIQKWVKALRSGKYKQTKRALQDSSGFCCLGVACKVFIPTKKIVKKENGTMMGAIPSSQPSAPTWLKRISPDVGNQTGLSLMKLNDIEKFTFDEIADVLEAVYIHEALND